MSLRDGWQSRSARSRRGARTEAGRTRARRGFTLIEIQVAVAIIGVLAGLAQATLRTYVMQAKRSEAKLGLESIYLAQTAYYGEFAGYGDTFDEIGSPIEGGDRVDDRTIVATTYTFTVRALPIGDDPRGNYQALASGDLDPGDGVMDILMIENQLTVTP
jgi:prepilin-type N-terminal cleavage/methylation domain-containing protein